MPVDYSKWDALELSDDSDIEVHPNVDKRSFIRAKQNQIHQERQQRKHQIETLKYERVINEGLMRRISALLSALKAHAAVAETRNPGEVAFQAVLESAGRPEDDQPPPRPAGVHTESEPLPSYSKMMATLLDQPSPAAQLFAQIRANDYAASLSFLSKHPEILTERETDGLLVMAFDAALERKDDWSRQCVHQALLLQYCRALGKDGVAMFFKRITTKGHQAQEVFYKDVTDTYARIRTRAREIVAERAKEPAEGVEQIQLHAVEPGTEIKIRIPPADSEEVEVKEACLIFESFSDEFRKALETGSLDKVNHVLGNMTVEAAEDVVAKLGDAGILSLEERIIDATTEEGRKALKEMEAAQTGTGAGSESGYAPDPE
ncbi:Hsp90 co-chaperone Cdc37 [Verticillium dahliae VdLs.17]|uniref:Hsp90 chaperone protein kinase-targeting subunit n=1 Tax=Verticillium dahliae (strain VdLs.17 / ATCC MYA-4575 / FGSC 10137) TaxID=498257 RepID=G2X7V2_VERDV|nr:Hsp90 co-chaperone Cdc37 [Verticillium dahliae VdLs.17]EGY15070.1 Hsp90 co-chaperone Cdc37 [Verticillium dahliae VdLs.17]